MRHSAHGHSLNHPGRGPFDYTSARREHEQPDDPARAVRNVTRTHGARASRSGSCAGHWGRHDRCPHGPGISPEPGSFLPETHFLPCPCHSPPALSPSRIAGLTRVSAMVASSRLRRGEGLLCDGQPQLLQSVSADRSLRPQSGRAIIIDRKT